MRHNYKACINEIELKQVMENDIELLRRWRNDKETTLYLRNVGYITNEMQRNWYEKYLDDSTEMIFGIYDKNLDCMVGSVALYGIDRERKEASIGKIQIGDSRVHGKGIGRKSLVMAMKIGFRMLGLKKITATVHPDNVQAYTNDMKVGFNIVGKCPSVVCGEEYMLEISDEDVSKKNNYYYEIVAWDDSADRDKLYIGKEGRFSKTISESDIYGFAGITGDFNIVHINAEEAKTSIFGKRVAHGMLVASFFSTVIGTIMPGSGTVYLEQDSKFIKPVYIGDTISVYVSVHELLPENKVKLRTEAYNQNKEMVVKGMAYVLVPERRSYDRT